MTRTLMVDPASLDVGAAYRSLRGRVTEILSNISAERWEQSVPHCPAWTIRETLAHLAGVVDDGIHGNMTGVATDAWTQAQVDKRADLSGLEILEEWNTYAPFVEARASEKGLALSQLLFDAVTHEHDLCFAVDVVGARDSDALAVGAHFLAIAVPKRLLDRGLPGVTLNVGGRVLHDAGVEALTVTASKFDFVRSFGSRRTLNQVRELQWSAPPDGVFEHMMPFAPPAQHLAE